LACAKAASGASSRAVMRRNRGGIDRGKTRQ
jgi:hypothetical protein